MHYLTQVDSYANVLENRISVMSWSRVFYLWTGGELHRGFFHSRHDVFSFAPAGVKSISK
jgi:hypothetical protein